MKYLYLILITALIPFNPSLAGYLDDGIKKDSSIQTNSKLELKENYNYLTTNINAKIARSKAGDESIKVIDGCGGIGNINVVGARNSKIKTVINASNNTGAVSNCKK
jgi:hypothetical protein